MKKRIIAVLLVLILAGNMPMLDLVAYAANVEVSAPFSVTKTEATPEQEQSVSDNTPVQKQEENEKLADNENLADNESRLDDEEQAENEPDGDNVETDTNIDSDSEAEVLYSGKDGNLNWSIDADGLLTISGVGDYEGKNFEESFQKLPQWYEYRSDIRSAEVSVSGIKSTAYMFYGCENMVSVDLSQMDTRQVTDMSYMFFQCGSLTNVNLETLNTSQVVNMSNMFYLFSRNEEDVIVPNTALKNIDVSHFDTSQVVDMSWMFYCSGLTSLDLSGFDTSQVTDMCGMFDGCTELTSLNIQGLDTSQVTDMESMFSDCKNIKKLDLSGFNTSLVRDMRHMFNGCSSLEFLDVSSFDTRNVKDMEMMFDICGTKNYMADPNMTLTQLDVSGFDTSNVTNMRDMFEGCGAVEELDVSNFNTSKVTDMSGMFEYCESVKEINTKNFDTSKVTGMCYMFAFCRNLEDLDVSGFDTENVTDMREMFQSCNKLKSLDLSNFKSNTDRVDAYSDLELETKMYGMSQLTLLKLPADWIEEDYLPSVKGYIWQNENGENCIKTQKAENAIKTYTRYSIDEKKTEIIYQGKDGDLDWKITREGVLYITGNGNYSDKCSDINLPIFENFNEKTKVPDWVLFAHSIKKTIVNVKNITKMNNMFYKCENMVSVDLSQMDTSQVTNMSYLFYQCGSLADVNLGILNTSQVVDMSYMFCMYSVNEKNIIIPNTALKKLDVSHFDTSQVYSMEAMFYGCAGLTNIDVSKFNTSQVTDMSYMFAYCNSLEELALDNFNVKKLSEADRIVDDLCDNLSTLIIPAEWNVYVKMPYSENGWKDQNGNLCNSIIMGLSVPMTYIRYSGAQMTSPSPAPTSMPSGNPLPSSVPTSPVPTKAPNDVNVKPVGAKITLNSNVGIVKVTSSDAKNPTVEYAGLTASGKKKKTVSIPEYVSYNGVKYRVTSVAAKCFKNDKKLTTVKIAGSVTKIGNSAFEGCSNLKTVTVGKGLKAIGKSVFKNCKSLKKITLKSTKLKTVGKTALKGVNAKCRIKVPAKKVKAYQKLFKGKGQKASVKIIK